MEVMENSDESNENERLKMRIAVLEESVKSCDVECKASRETVVRLVAELDRERRKSSNSAAALDSLKVELDGLAAGRRSVDMETQTLTERLEASKRVIEAAKRESNCLEKQVQELERKLQASQKETQAAQEKLHMFLKKVSGLLQVKCESTSLPTEKDILLQLDKTVTELEARLYHASRELNERTELQHGATQRAQLAEQQVQDLRGRLRGLETELLDADVHRDKLRHSKQQYEEFLEQLSETMKVDNIALDVGSDMRLKLILSRAQQLVKQEGTALAERQSLTYSLQRKLKSQKEQLESKALHVQFLRKKVSELEEEKRSRLAAEGEEGRLEARRLQRKLERLQNELKAAKLSNTELKGQLSHTNELQLNVMEQSQAVQEHKKRVDQLLEEKTKMEKQLQSRDRKGRDDQQELHAVRQRLAQLSERERELLDFRMVVSQMLGLDTTASANPNYEIIQFLETLLHTHHHHHHLHHHVSTPWLCPTHQMLCLSQIQDRPGGSSLDVSTLRSACPEDAVAI